MKVFLQGSYNTSTGMMRADLINLDSFPTLQPYSAVPWDYYGALYNWDEMMKYNA